MSDQQGPFDPDPEILDQLETVRSDGRANMMSIHEVQSVANDLELYDLVVYCQDVIQMRQSERARTWMTMLRELE